MSSHQPFHWFVEFPSVWRAGGFDVIIGNPPYIKTSKVTGYRWLGCQTQKCPDLYAVCMERASTLLNDRGRFAMIVMHNLCFSRHFWSLRAHLIRRFGELRVSSYSRIPDALFGGEVRVRNSIVLASMRGEGSLYATPCRRWTSEARDRLFEMTSYADWPHLLRKGTPDQQWPFVEPGLGQVIEWLAESNARLGDATSRDGEFLLGYKNTAQYTLGVFVAEPPTVDLNSGESVETKSRRANWFCFSSRTSRDLALTVLAGCGI